MQNDEFGVATVCPSDLILRKNTQPQTRDRLRIFSVLKTTPIW
ncbi:hypothetical protein CKA32_006989 [Geitlerinema sp. FC II]|nr:hypothetical protein CKA32_006989 [Geitlerinema sp. FC II]